MSKYSPIVQKLNKIAKPRSEEAKKKALLRKIKRMTPEEFKSDIFKEMKSLPSNWRKGQKVFNYIECEYHVARTAQFEKGIDCFYDDNQIDKFIEESFKLIK